MRLPSLQVEFPEKNWNWREHPICQYPVYVPSSQRTYSGSASSWKPTLAQTSPCLSVKLSLNHLNYAINVATQGSWLKLWDTALDYGSAGTHQALAILRALTTPLFGDRKCPVPQCTYPVIENTHSLTTSWNTTGQMPSHPRNPYQTSHRQSWKSSGSRPALSQNSAYMFILISLCVIM